MNKTYGIIGAIIVVIVLVIGAFIALSGNNNDSDSSTGYTLEEVAEHNSKTSCWMVIRDVVYDVTDYINSHPGGSFILDGCGTDATALFEGTSDEGARATEHSNTAKNILQSYEIGKLK